MRARCGGEVVGCGVVSAARFATLDLFDEDTRGESLCDIFSTLSDSEAVEVRTTNDLKARSGERLKSMARKTKYASCDHSSQLANMPDHRQRHQRFHIAASRHVLTRDPGHRYTIGGSIGHGIG